MFSINNLPRYYVLSALFFLLFIFFGYDSLFGSSALEFDKVDTSSEIIVARLSRALAELNSLKAQNDELRQLLHSYIPNSAKANSIYLKEDDHVPKSESLQQTPSGAEPSSKFEIAHRKLHTDINELWNFVRTMKNSSSIASSQNFIHELKDSLLFDLETIRERDEEWRRTQLSGLSKYVQRLFHKLQHPQDCSKARKLVCNLNKGCGFGCQLHHVVYCSIVAMATERTLILNSKSWRYVSNKKQSKSLWESAFKPLSESCTDDKGISRSNWGASSENTQVVFLPIIDSLRDRPDYLPLSIPHKISDRLIKLHGAPSVWFIGQIIKYLLRPTPEVEEFLNERRQTFDFKGGPIVGVHVRRTDKITTEASYHPLSEYMVHVEEYYKQLSLWNQRRNVQTPIEKRVYLATDDIGVWKNEISSYKDKGYKFIGDDQISNTATVRRRYSFDSLKNVILDIQLLSETDFLVCTFSSQICRVAYELMQSHNASIDHSADYRSLDDIFYFGGQNAHNQVAILDHEAVQEGELSIKSGDTLGIAGNHWNGFNKGLNRGSQEKGFYPAFKAREKIDISFFQLFQNDKSNVE